MDITEVDNANNDKNIIRFINNNNFSFFNELNVNKEKRNNFNLATNKLSLIYYLGAIHERSELECSKFVLAFNATIKKIKNI